jgi:protein phosphatase 1G
MDEMMRGQRGWRELQALGDKMNQFTGMIEGLIWSPKGSDSNAQHDDWAFEEVILQHELHDQLFFIGEVIFIAHL